MMKPVKNTSLLRHRKTLPLWLAGSACTAVMFLGLSAGTEARQTVVEGLDCVVEPSTVVELGTSVPGLLAHHAVDRGDFVARGDVIGELESGVERSSLAIALATVDQKAALELRELGVAFSERTLRRNTSLVRTASISAQDLDQVETETRVAELQLAQERESHRLAQLEVERAREILQRRRIVSPIDGTVVDRYKSPGEYVDGDPVFKLAQLDPLHVEVIVPLDYLGQIEAGMPASINVLAPGFDQRRLDARVHRIDSLADAASGTFGVRVVLDNPDHKIPGGVRCQIDFHPG